MRMEKEKHTAAIIIFSIAIAALIGFAIYVAVDHQATHKRWVGEYTGAASTISELR